MNKKKIAVQLDEMNTLYNFAAETGLTSYKNYTLLQLQEILRKEIAEVRFCLDN